MDTNTIIIQPTREQHGKNFLNTWSLSDNGGDFEDQTGLSSEELTLAVKDREAHYRNASCSTVIKTNQNPSCTIIYNRDGFTWIRYGDVNKEGEGFSLPKPKYALLSEAFFAAVRSGHNPSHWTRPGMRPIMLDQVTHWRKHMAEGKM